MKKVNIQIKNRWTGTLIFEYSSEDNTMLKTLYEAIKMAHTSVAQTFSGANLRRILPWRKLSGANLSTQTSVTQTSVAQTSVTQTSGVQNPFSGAYSRVAQTSVAQSDPI